MILGALLLLLAAMACVAAELFVPTHGLLTLCAALLALLSIILAAKASPAFGLLFGLAIIIASPVVFFFAIRLYPHTPMGRRVMLKAPRLDTIDPNTAETQRLARFVGMRGTTLTTLRPAGSVDLAGERIDCLSESDVIEPGAPVEVLRVTGRKVIVKPIT